MKVLVCLVVVLLCALSSATVYDYSKQDEWEDECNTGSSQSPIDFTTPGVGEAAGSKVSVKSLNITSFFSLPVSAETTPLLNDDDDNNVMFYFDIDFQFLAPIENVTVESYDLELHWGADSSGSQHLIDGVQYAAEVQLMTDYMENNERGDYVIISRLFTIGAANAEIQQMIDAQKATDSNERNIASFNMSALFPSDVPEIIHYSGSLTIPDCEESVEWYVIPTPLTISEAQLTELRTLPLGDGTGAAKEYNWRNVQEKGDRVVTWYTLGNDSAAASLFISPLLLVAAVAKLAL